MTDLVHPIKNVQPFEEKMAITSGYVLVFGNWPVQNCPEKYTKYPKALIVVVRMGGSLMPHKIHGTDIFTDP